MAQSSVSTKKLSIGFYTRLVDTGVGIYTSFRRYLNADLAQSSENIKQADFEN
jgi:hypothetical protein